MRKLVLEVNTFEAVFAENLTILHQVSHFQPIKVEYQCIAAVTGLQETGVIVFKLLLVPCVH